MFDLPAAFVGAAPEAGIRSFCVLQHGRTLLEGYAAPCAPDDAFRLYSLTKSFTIAAVALCAEDGLLSPDDHVCDLLPEFLPEHPSENLRAVTLRDLFTMRMGHHQETLDFLSADDWTRSILAEPFELPPGQRFVYDNRASYLLAAVVQRYAGQTAYDLLRERVFEPLGFENASWTQTPNGVNPGGFGLSLRLRDLAAYGQLLLRQGIHQGRRLLPWTLMADAVQTQVPLNEGWKRGYGYQFWQCEVPDAVVCAGALGQRLYVFPAQDAVVALNGGAEDVAPMHRLVTRLLLPWLTRGEAAALPPVENRGSLRGGSKAEPCEPAETHGHSHEALETALGRFRIPTPAGDGSESEGLFGVRFPTGENPHGIRALTLSSGAEEDLLTVEREGDTLGIPIGRGEYRSGVLNVDEGTMYPCLGDFFRRPAACGVWDAGAYRMRVVWRGTPYVDDWRFTRENGKLRAEWVRAPGFEHLRPTRSVLTEK